MTITTEWTGSPYRPLPIYDEPPKVEAAHCDWCRWSDLVSPLQCSHPVVSPGGYAGKFCKGANPRGQCPYHEPSGWTRVLRALHLGRAPAMVDPGVWDVPS